MGGVGEVVTLCKGNISLRCVGLSHLYTPISNSKGFVCLSSIVHYVLAHKNAYFIGAPLGSPNHLIR